MGLLGCTKKSETNYHSTLRKIPRQRRSHLHNGRSLNTCMVKPWLYTVLPRNLHLQTPSHNFLMHT